MTSPDLTRANIDKIAELFPGVLTEALDADGESSRAIDFDLLRQELSDHIVEGPQERYQLDWPGKRAAAFAANAPIAKTLRPVREESVDFETTRNLFIEGDNLDALKLLQESYLGKVKLIYIDPPYNTGNDFVYEDDFAESSADYLTRSGQKSETGDRLVANTEANGRFHSDWLSMMYPRLRLARNLLTNDGVLLVSISDVEVANLREMLDEIYGPQNFIASVVWQGGRKNDSRYVSVGHDYVLIYARDEMTLRDSGVRWREKKAGVDEARAAGRRAWEQSGHDAERATAMFRAWLSAQKELTPAVSRFKNIDDAGRVYNADKDLGWPGGGGPRYDVIHPTTGKPVKVPSTGWRFTENSFREQIRLGLVEFGVDENKIPRGKTFLDELEDQVAESVFTQIRTTAAQRLSNLVGSRVFDYPKDEFVLARWFDLVTCSDPDALVLDFFAGSGSAAHAVLNLNSLDGGRRRFIAVQLGEPTPPESSARAAGFSSIPEIARARIQRAVEGIRAGSSRVLADGGFRSLHVATTNMADTLTTADDLVQSALSDAVGSIKPDRTDEDLLFQVLLGWGIDLAEPIAVEEVEDRRVLSVADDALIACFSEHVTDTVVRAIAARHPLRAVFMDAGFATDSARINAQQIFHEVSPETDVKTV
ncbi:site-specific DNA-methyltransferase [Microbacterium sp. zg-YB36]|uniref:site-specific DNA-methyltransferase n=1 Tax=Microbacterium sp. zg-YB36 TaxID=2969407 RepID=UPI00214A973F|nr:site-specific DNA-methyltransferase [Microbacterium sp. zg-YB36]MDL5350947.1 site-specific DNA-methyltransferase [Microbacterium sp. zg-YB36]